MSGFDSLESGGQDGSSNVNIRIMIVVREMIANIRAIEMNIVAREE